MMVENCKVTITLDRNEVWTMAYAMSGCVKNRAKNYIEYKGTYFKGFWEDKPVEHETRMVRDLYYSIGEVIVYQSFEREIKGMFEETDKETPQPT